MRSAAYDHILKNPKLLGLVAARTRFAWTLALVMLGIYYGFILIIAFAPGFLGIRIGAGVMTIGIPIGIAVILSAFVITGIYVHRANSVYDELTRQIIEESR